MRHQPRERAFHGDGLTADIKTAIDDDGEQRNHRHHAHKAQVFAHHRHQEVGVVFVPGIQIGEQARPTPRRQPDQHQEGADQHGQQAAEVLAVDTAQEQDADGDRHDHHEGAQVGLQQQQHAHAGQRESHRQEAPGERLHVFLLAHGVVGSVEQRGQLHQFGRLEVQGTQGNPAVGTIDLTADAGDQHRDQQDHRHHEQRHGHALPDADRDRQHHGPGKQPGADEQAVADHEVVAPVGRVTRAVGQRDRRRIHHQQAKQQQRRRRDDQRQIEVAHFGTAGPYGIDAGGEIGDQAHATSRR
ncbi:hypothetical protein G6F57_017203 [Rhizopus arrhizus]|nr:hypothetical protein G6F57_017203 [Rhizopus arrhizus]